MTQGANVYTTAMARQNRRRKQLIAGVAGLAVVLGSGAYFVTSAITDDTKIAPNDRALAPIEPASSVKPSESPSSAAPSPTATASRSAMSPSALPSIGASLQKRIDAARSAHARLGTQVRPPLPQALGVVVPPEDIKVTNAGTLKSPQGTMRLVTAKGDMTGQQELAWVTDDGKQYGDVRCSQTFRFSAGLAPTLKPTMLICWRTSMNKSVYTVAVKLDGPSPDPSVVLVNKEWAKLS